MIRGVRKWLKRLLENIIPHRIPQSTPIPLSNPNCLISGMTNCDHHIFRVPEEAHDSMYGGVNWETSNALSTFLFGSNSNVNERLLAQTEGQDQPSIQERRNQMRFSVHGWEFLDRKSDDDMQSRGTQRKGDMDALLSQVGTWPVDFGYEYKSDSPEGRTTQLQRGRHEAATKTKKTSNIGPWC